MKIVGIGDVSGAELISEKEIFLQVLNYSSYENPLVYYVYSVKKPNEMKVNTDYQIAISGQSDAVVLALSEIGTKTINNTVYNVYCFMYSEFSVITKNISDTSFELFGIKFDTCLSWHNNMQYFLHQLRRKGLMFKIDNSNIQALDVTNPNSCFVDTSTEESLQNTFEVKYLKSSNFKKNNYFTVLEDGTVLKTKYGIGEFKYLPIATKEDFDGLDGYIINEVEIKTDFSDLNIGSGIKIDDVVYVVISKTITASLKEIKTRITLGRIVADVEDINS